MMKCFFFNPLSLFCDSLSVSSSSSLLFLADVESRSSDEENELEEREEAERKTVFVTSIDEALRTVNDSRDHGQEDFLKQNFETLAENCSSGMAEQTLTYSFK